MALWTTLNRCILRRTKHKTNRLRRLALNDLTFSKALFLPLSWLISTVSNRYIKCIKTEQYYFF